MCIYTHVYIHIYIYICDSFDRPKTYLFKEARQPVQTRKLNEADNAEKTDVARILRDTISILPRDDSSKIDPKLRDDMPLLNAEHIHLTKCVKI